MSSIEKAILGALGGFSAVLVKFLGQDYAHVVAHASNLTADQLLAYQVGYGLLTPILMFLGGFVAWISDERKRIKIVALAVAAPAMITTWSGGHKVDSVAAALPGFLIPTAHAQPADPRQAPPLRNPDAVTQKGTLQRIKEGVGVFFGYGGEPKKYWVIVGSFKDRDAAQRFADQVNAEDKTLNAWVGVTTPGNDYYPVIVGDYAYLSQAKDLRQRALATASVKEAYLSTGERR
ncbi:MAG TPA: SPOR domain-containing protein [Paucimonas sp.]|nr:SPOR domain-containing protein [Paucimonas sp.]